MKKKGKAGICGLFVLIVLPCLFTGFICGKEACPVVKKSSMEDYVAAVTATQISWSAPKEAIKAQTVIARGNLYVKWRAGKGGREVKNASIYLKKRKMDDLQNKYNFSLDFSFPELTMDEILNFKDQ